MSDDAHQRLNELESMIAGLEQRLARIAENPANDWDATFEARATVRAMFTELRSEIRAELNRMLQA